MSQRCSFCGRWKPRGNLACDHCLGRCENRVWQAILVVFNLAVIVTVWLVAKAVRP